MDALGREINALLMNAYRSILKVEEDMLKSTSQGALSIGELHAIEAIAQGRRAGVSVSDVAQRLKVSLPSATVTIAKLVKKGYAEKSRSAQDGRVVTVRLTRLGSRANAAHHYFHEQMVSALLSSLKDSERQALIGGLNGLNGFLKRTSDRLKAETAAGGEKKL